MMRSTGLIVAVFSSFALAACQQQSTDGAAPASSASAAPAPGQVDAKRLLAVDSEPGAWLTGGRDFGSSHFSPLDSITRENVKTLGFAWDFATGTDRGMEATPIVVDGVMYTSGVAGRVYALDAATGKLLWRFEPPADLKYTRSSCCDQVNRGVAVWQGRVYVASIDGILYSLDARDGHVIWKADTIIDRARGYTVTGAPQVAGNVVVIGNGGAELDARGYISAYKLDSGEQAWRFFIVPGDPSKPFENPELEMAAKTWDPNRQWQLGGGGTAWDSMAWDPKLNLLYVGTGNGAPWNRELRSPKGGDNLFLSSILAIDPDTARLVWYYQEVPGDQWDYTATQHIQLATLTIDGRPRDVLMHAPKNGFFYVLDRKTGELLSADPYEDVTWASHIDLKTGRPAFNLARTEYADGKPKVVFPSPVGAHNWNPMSFSSRTGLVYIPTVHFGATLSKPKKFSEYRPGRFNTNVNAGFGVTTKDPEALKGIPDPTPSAALKAWDPVKRQVVWTGPKKGFMDHGGVLSTAGGLVMQGGLDGNLRIFDDTSGELLHEIMIGSAMIAAPMMYSVNGVPYVAILAGSGGGGWSSWMPDNIASRNGNANRIVALRLDGGAVPQPDPLPPLPAMSEPPKRTGTKADIEAGSKLFAANCAHCHTNAGRGPAPDLRRSTPETHAAFQQIVRDGALQPRGMPRWDDLLTVQEVDQIHAYLIDLGWKLWESEKH
jgi:quinohemoprotein ethanol dehydrogenase